MHRRGYSRNTSRTRDPASHRHSRTHGLNQPHEPVIEFERSIMLSL
jgi:hypothetical protein